MNKVDGKIALIVGRSDGICLAIAQEFVANGAYLSITGRRISFTKLPKPIMSALYIHFLLIPTDHPIKYSLWLL